MIALIIMLIFLSFNSMLYADIHNAASCSQSDVTTAIANASSGDTVSVPDGNCTWSTSVVIDKGITLKGSGIDATNIKCNVTFNPTNSTTGACIIFTNGINNIRVTGFTIDGDADNYDDFMAIRISKALNKEGCHDFRIDNNKFSNFRTIGSYGNGDYVIRSYGFNYGVIDSNIFYDCRGESIYLSGDGSDAYERTPEIGGYTNGTIFVENNQFILSGVESVNGANPIDMAEGVRVVFRHNLIEGTSSSRWQQPVELHGFCVDDGLGGSVKDIRATLSFEIYNNLMCSSECTSNIGNGDRVYRIRGGTGVVYSNESHGSFTSVVYLDNERSYDYGICVTETRATPAYSNQAHVDTGVGIHEGLVGEDLVFGSIRDQVQNIYFWSNTHNGSNVTNSDVYIQNSGYVRNDIVLDSQYFFSQKSYTSYTCPHPLTGYAGVCNPSIAGTGGYNLPGNLTFGGGGVMK